MLTSAPSHLEIRVEFLQPQYLLIITVWIPSLLIIAGQLESPIGQADERPDHVRAEIGVKVSWREATLTRSVARPASHVAEYLRRRHWRTKEGGRYESGGGVRLVVG